MSEVIIRARNLSFQYEDSQHGIYEMNFEIYQGEVILLAGNSGSGKSTLLKCLNGLIPNIIDGKLSGSLTLREQEYLQLPMYEINRDMASVFQNPRSQFFTTDTTSEMAFAMENYGYKRQEMKRIVKDIVEEFDMGSLMDRDIFELSSGERQMLALASSKTLGQKIFIFDEPSANLDYGNALFLSKQIKALKQKGASVIVADHRFYYLTDCIDRIFFVEDGRLRIFNSQEEFQKSDYDTRSFHLFGSVFPDRIHDAFGKKLAQVCDLGYKNILYKIDFELFENQILVLIGNNGVGKTTLAKLLAGSLKSDKGKVEMEEMPFFIMQDADYQLFGTSVENELKLLPNQPSSDRIDAVLEGLNLIHLKDAHPFELSGGEKQRLQIALAALCDKKILIFDEPTSGLDAIRMKSVSEHLYHLKQRASIFVISHDYEFIRNVADRVIYMEGGKIADDFILNSENVFKLNSIFKNMEERYVQK